MKPYLLLLLLVPVCLFAQTNTGKTEAVKPALDDCPTWGNKPRKSSKSDYFKYLSKGAEKKTEQTTAQQTTVAQNKPVKRTQKTAEKKESPKTEVPGTATNEPEQTTEPAVKEPQKKQEVTEPEKKTEITEPQTDDKTIGSGSAGADKKEITKKKESKLKKKLNRLFSKKNNKAAKPNYKKCSTSF